MSRISLSGEAFAAFAEISKRESENQDGPETWNSCTLYAHLMQSVSREFRTTSVSGVASIDWGPQSRPPCPGGLDRIEATSNFAVGSCANPTEMRTGIKYHFIVKTPHLSRRYECTLG